MLRGLAISVPLLVVASLPSVLHQRAPNYAPGPPTRATESTNADVKGLQGSVPQQDSLTSKFAGTWTGTLESPHGSGDGLTLVIAREKGVWTASMTMPPGQPIPAGTISDVKVSAGGLTWTQSFDEMTCKGSASLVGEHLKGETDCGHVSMAFLLKRK